MFLSFSKRFISVTLFVSLVLGGFLPSSAYASDPVGVYARLSKIEADPINKTVILHGLFSLADHVTRLYTAPKYGILFYTCEDKLCIQAVTDLKQHIGSSTHCAGFGSRYPEGVNGSIQPPNQTPKNPIPFPTNLGVTSIEAVHGYSVCVDLFAASFPSQEKAPEPQKEKSPEPPVVPDQAPSDPTPADKAPADNSPTDTAPKPDATTQDTAPKPDITAKPDDKASAPDQKSTDTAPKGGFSCQAVPSESSITLLFSLLCFFFLFLALRPSSGSRS